MDKTDSSDSFPFSDEEEFSLIKPKESVENIQIKTHNISFFTCCIFISLSCLFILFIITILFLTLKTETKEKPKPLSLLISEHKCYNNGSCCTWYGYNNPNENFFIPIGQDNYFSEDPIDRNQTTNFTSGLNHYVFFLETKHQEKKNTLQWIVLTSNVGFPTVNISIIVSNSSGDPGACCFENGNCLSSVTPQTCSLNGGSFLGDNTLCSQCSLPFCLDSPTNYTLLGILASGNGNVDRFGVNTLNGNLYIAGTGGLTDTGTLTVNGKSYLNDNNANNALTYASLIYTEISSFKCGITLPIVPPTSTLYPNTYCFNPGAVSINNILTLNGGGNPNAYFFFIVNSTNTLTINNNIVLTNGTSYCNVYWISNNDLFLNGNINGNFINNGTIIFDFNTILNGGALSICNNKCGTTGEIQLRINTITNACPQTICNSFNGACCLNSQCYSMTYSNCTLLGGSFSYQNCTSGLCLLPIIPILNCTINYGNGTCLTYFSYNNTNSISVNISQGSYNYFIPSSINNQPTIFLPGFNKNQFEVIWKCNISSIFWNITTGI